MAASLNLHRLFYIDDGYLRRLYVPEEDKITLSDAREKIRVTLREAFRNWQNFVTKAELFDPQAAGVGANDNLPAPKFRIQGSFAYHTANDCQQTPPQQIDQDDGMFLPVSFITNDGSFRPRITSRAYFALVEGALKPLCQREGWILNPGGPKDSCVRVGIDARLHIDVPLYAIKDEAYEQLTEASARMLAKADSMAQDAFKRRAAEELSDEVYEALNDSEMALATRSDGWKGSDPRKLELWFKNALNNYGAIVRRLSRSFKGLRDAHWSECDLGSICIMAAVVNALERVWPLENNRDDLALLAVGREMVKIFANPIHNPAFPGDPDKYLCNGWNPEFRSEVRRVIRDACDELEAAIFDTVHKGVAIRHARAAFGNRVPNDESLISLVGVAEVIRRIEPAPQPKPMVPRTKSG